MLLHLNPKCESVFMITSHKMESIQTKLAEVTELVKKAYNSIENNSNKLATLVAVAKKQPKECIIRAYECGQRDFGENYIQELYDKATDKTVLEACPDIRWHLIGHLQTNKINKLLEVPNLHAVQTIDSIKLAQTLESHIVRRDDRIVNVFVQVNTSGEESKSGINPEEVSQLYAFIRDSCPHLRVLGLMTIGIYGFEFSHDKVNPDFVCLLKCREDVCSRLHIADKNCIELSMGMSCDFEHAIQMGSTIVRVGTSIFGERQY